MITRRIHTGSLAIFERRFKPLLCKEGALIWHNSEIPRPIVGRHWWTVLDCDGKLYVSAGFHFVNRIGYIKTEIPWTDADHQRDWRYD